MDTEDTTLILQRWATALRQYGLAGGVDAFLMALAPLRPLSAALFAGGGFLLSPWLSQHALQAVQAILSDEEARRTFLETLHSPGAAS